MTTFSEQLAKRRSIRDFEEREVPLSLVREIIDEACLAPSARNDQPWHFIIINNRDVIRRLSDESKRNILDEIDKDPASSLARYEGALRNEEFNVFWNAPCLVYIAGPGDVTSLQVDCALAAAWFMFSAASRGLGTCWIGLGSHIRDPETKTLIGLPEHFRIVAPIVLGYPRTIPKAPPRKPPSILAVIG